MRDRFLTKYLVVPSGCWEWQASRLKTGYPYGWFWDSEGKRMRTAHRVSYEIFKGDIGDKDVLHSCDNPGCVNPDHLFLGTHSDNMKDMFAKGRCDRSGERHGRARFKREDIERMRKDRLEGMSYSQIMKKYSIYSKGHLGDILSGRTWA